jgi:pyrroline-5-carboxylate reductase
MPNVAALVQASYTAFCCDQDVQRKIKKKIKVVLGLDGFV